jgi:hypothetical protein
MHSDQCVVFRNIIDRRLAARRKTFVVFIDLKQAYDRVWRNGLFHKLGAAGADGRFLVALKSMYTAAEARVKLSNCELSQPFRSNCGVRQGCNF